MHADKWGPLGSIFASLCCLGFAPLLGVLSAIGLGFLVNDLILVPLLTFFLAITTVGTSTRRKAAREEGPCNPGMGRGVADRGRAVDLGSGHWFRAGAPRRRIRLELAAHQTPTDPRP